MAGTSLLALLDDIATVLDDISVMTKVAAKKTAGVLGDDLALNAEKVTGVRAERELPVVWAVAKGSFLNKLILVPAALLISAVAPWLIIPMLMLGGAFLCYEGFEKIAHHWLHSASEEQAEHLDKLKALSDPEVDLVAYERDKIRGAIRTDFILSAEIIVISLGIVSGSAFMTQVAVVSTIAFCMTVVVYSLVGGIVKLDDAGLYLVSREEGARLHGLGRGLGRLLLLGAPWLMKVLSVVGTAAMFLVGGGILIHGTPGGEHWQHSVVEWLAEQAGSALAWFVGPLSNALVGIVAGAILVGLIQLGTRLFGRAGSTGST
jgi:predicted DNA repair protein MutK